MKYTAIILAIALGACTTQTITTTDPATGKSIITKTTSQDPAVAGAIAQAVASAVVQGGISALQGDGKLPTTRGLAK